MCDDTRFYAVFDEGVNYENTGFVFDDSCAHGIC